jgi:YVTN family beta-propeller protein
MKPSFYRAFLFGAVPIRRWITKLCSFAITLSTLLLLAQATYAAVGPVTLNLTPDDYGSETTWTITDSSGTPIAEGGPYEDGNTTPIAETIDLPIATGYTFTIYDSFGDGIISPGSYSLDDAEGTVIASGGEFASEESTQFDIIPTGFAITGTPVTKLGPNQAYSFTPIVYGNDGSPLTFSINTQPAWANFDANTGALTGTPTDSDIGTTNGIEITVSNGPETATLPAFDITVVANTPPTITGTPPTTAKVGWTYRFTPTANDADGDSLSFSITNKPDWAEFDPNTGILSGTPDAEGTTNIEISVSDEMAATTVLTFDLTVINVSYPHILDTIPINGNSIAVNYLTNQIYMAYEKGNIVTVIDGYNPNLKTTIVVGNNPTAMAINQNTNKIYVVNSSSDNVTVIDGNTFNTMTVAVGDYPGAIAINPDTNQIYVINYFSDNMTVIDGNTLDTTTVSVGDHPVAIAINPNTNKIYVANQNSYSITVIDSNTLDTTTITKVGDFPYAIAINPNTNKIYVALSDYDSNNVMVIDGDTLDTTTITVGVQPFAIAINPNTNKIYVANYGSHNVTVIDDDTLDTTTIGVKSKARIIAINPQINQIYVVGDGIVTVIDGNTNQTTTIDNVNANYYPKIAINPNTNKIFVNATSELVVIDGSPLLTTTTVIEEIENEYSVDAMAINPNTHQIYVETDGTDITIIDGKNNQEPFTLFNVGDDIEDIAINPNTNQIYAVESWGSVIIIDGNNNYETTSIDVGHNPKAIAVNPQTNKIYVANLNSDDITVIDGNTLDITTVPVEQSPITIAINPDTNQIYVGHVSNNVTIIDGKDLSTTTLAIEEVRHNLAITINPNTNQIYMLNFDNVFDTFITIIDGNTFDTTTIAVDQLFMGLEPPTIVVDVQTNQIYMNDYSSQTIGIIDGNTLNTTYIALGMEITAIAINQNTYQLYGAAYPDSIVMFLLNLESTHPNPLPVEIMPLADDTVFHSSPTFSFNATGDIAQVYYQTPWGTDKTWHRATLTGGKWQGTTPPLPRGKQFIRAFATDEVMEATLNNAAGTNSPFIGEISSYFFTVVTSPILLDNSGNPYLTEITEDIEPAKNTGTLLADMLATGALGDPITDGDYDAVEGIAVVAVDNTNGTWEYSIDNGTTWTTFGTPSNTNARLLADKPQTRIRFQPNSNFNGTVESGITFHAWDQSFGDNGGLFDLTDSQLDPYTFSPDTETASITVGDAFEQFTALYLETSAVTILNSDLLDITGKLSVYPTTGQDLSGYELDLIITAPDGTTTHVEPLTTNTDTGQFEWKAVSLSSLFNPMQKGPFGFQAKFAGSAELAASQSATEAVLVGSSAGYAILVQGKIQNAEGLAAHNKTIHRIYKKFKERGFDDGNIKYFNYNTKQPGVDGLPIKADIAAALTELQARMNSNPAPFYIVMIDHGGIDGTFHIYGGHHNENDVITPTDLNLWLNHLEDGLSDTAIQEPRLVMLGACYSGSFIPELSKAGRTIITSATAQEESYKGPEEPDGIRSGEFFMEEFFARLGRSDNLKAAFEFATAKTEAFTRKGDGNSANRFYDEATQHPLLDDNGDGQGSNTLTAAMNSDGHSAETILLGVGLNYNTNSALNPAEILSVSNTIYLYANESATTLEIKVNNANHVNSAPVDIRKPSVILSSTGTETSEQLEITNLPRRFMSCSSTNLCVADFDQFIEPGMYEAFYFVRDNETNDISPVKRSVIYKNYANNPAPNAFDLVEPLDGSEHKTTLIFKWNPSSDADGPVTYNFIVAKDSSFNEIVYQQEELNTAMTYVDDTVALADQTTYYWKVEAVDPFGERTTSRSVFAFTTNNTNAPPSIASLHVSSAVNFTSLGHAVIDFWQLDENGVPILDAFGNPIPVAQPPVIHQEQGFYNMLLPFGRRRAVIQVDGFEDQVIDLDTSDGLARLNVEMVPIGGIPTQPGQLQFAATTASVNENEGTVTILVERVDGIDGAISVNYTTGDGSSTVDSDYTNTNGTLNWSDKDERAKAIVLPILDDQEFEGNETLTITLSNPTGEATLGTPNQITVTIVDDEAAPAPVPGTLQFSSSTYSTEEGESTLNILVTRTDGNEGEIFVQYLVSGTATLNQDYMGGTGTLTWYDGDNTDKRLNISIIDDEEVEETETLQLSLVNPIGATLGYRDTATLSITDNDVATSAGTLQFKTATQTVTEGEAVTLTITRTDGTDGEVSVQYMTTGESTATSSDYTGGSGTLTWDDGEEASQSFTIKVIEDEDVEETESIQLTLLSPTGEATLGSPAQATVTITDNDVNTEPVTEPEITETESVATESETAVVSSEIETPKAEVLDSENAKPEALDSKNAKAEALDSENAKADALNSENAKADALNSENAKADALNSKTPTLESESKAQALDVESKAQALESENAKKDNDEIATSGSNVFVVEPETTGPVSASNVSDLEHVATESRDNGILQFMAPFYTVNEGIGPLTTFTVTRTGGSNGDVSVQYRIIEDGTAVKEQDYRGGSGLLTWSDGDSTPKSIHLDILDDTDIEGLETIAFALTKPTGGAVLGTFHQRSLLLIADNDEQNDEQEALEANQTPEPLVESDCQPDKSQAENEDNSDSSQEEKAFDTSLEENQNAQPEDKTLSFSKDAYTVSEEDGTVALTVLREGDSFDEISVRYIATIGSTASLNSDYTGSEGILTWNAEEKGPQSLEITIVDDEQIEDSETVHLLLFNATDNVRLGSPSQATVTILDNDGVDDITSPAFLPSLGRGTNISSNHLLPSLGQGMAISKETLLRAKRVKSELGLTVAFKGGAKIGVQNYQFHQNGPYYQMVKILGEIDVATEHVGQKADILIVAQSIHPSHSQYFMLDKQGQAMEWLVGDFDNLVAAKENVLLKSNQEIEIYHGFLSPLHLQIYFGYRLENELILFNGEQPIEVQVE